MSSFLIMATLYLGVMVFIAPLSVRLGLGSVLGYLLGGVLIGPVMGLTGSFNGHLQHFAEFGVVMMMFIIGLEVRPEQLWAMRRRLLGMGFSQVAFTALIAGLITHALGQDPATCIVVGMVASLSSTAIVMQTMDEKRLSHTDGGRASFAILLAQDVLAVLMLLALPFLSGKAADEEHSSLLEGVSPVLAVGVSVGALLAVIAAGRWLIPAVARFVHRARMREMDAALALFSVVAISLLMSLLGLSPALGAFLAGVMLAESHIRHDLESHIDPYKGLLLGVFFVTVGAGMDIRMIMDMPVIIICATLILMAIKAGVLNLVARIARLSRPDRALVTLSLAQAGEFGLVVASVASSLAVVSNTTAAGLTTIIALSMLLTPGLFWLNDRVANKWRSASLIRHDEIGESGRAVIIAGMGRFGRVVHRMLDMAGTRTVVLDPDPETVREVRSYGIGAYYGDPALPGVLEQAGVKDAAAIAVCIDDDDAAVRIVELARRAAPTVRIIARARDIDHACRLAHAGADQVVRELLDSSLEAGRMAVMASGVDEDTASRIITVYREAEADSWDEIYDAWSPSTPSQRNERFMEARKRSVDGAQAALSQYLDDKAAEREHPKAEGVAPGN